MPGRTFSKNEFQNKSLKLVYTFWILTCMYLLSFIGSTGSKFKVKQNPQKTVSLLKKSVMPSNSSNRTSETHNSPLVAFMTLRKAAPSCLPPNQKRHLPNEHRGFKKSRPINNEGILRHKIILFFFNTCFNSESMCSFSSLNCKWCVSIVFLLLFFLLHFCEGVKA